MTATTTAASVAIRTVHAAPEAPMICVRVDRRDSTKDGKKIIVPKENRHRSIHITGWELAGVPEKFAGLIRSALDEAASEQLRQITEGTDGLLRKETDASLFIVDSLLAFAARETERKRFTAANITEWFAASHLQAWIIANKGEDAQRLVKLYGGNLASCYNATSTKALGLKTIENAIAAMGKAPEDMEHPTAQTVMEKLLEAQKVLTEEMNRADAL